MKSEQENKEEIYIRLNNLEKEVESLKINLGSKYDIKINDQKKYEMDLTSGNKKFLKVLSISIIIFFIVYWILRIINS